LRSLPFFNRLHSFLEAPTVTVPTPMGNGVKRVGDGHDPRFQWNSPPLQSFWITGAIPSLVVRGDGFPERRVEG
jgi:hypothetical protein